MKETQNPPYSLKNAYDAAPPPIFLGGQMHNHLHVLKKRKSIVFFSLAFCLFAAVFVNLVQKPVYRSSARITFEPNPVEAMRDTWSVMSLMYDPTFLYNQINLTQNPRFGEKALAKIESPENRKALLKSFEIKPDRKRDKESIFSPSERQALTSAIQNSVSVSQIEKGVNVLLISVTGYVPSVLPLVATAVAETYIDMNYEANMESFQKSFLVISRSLSDVQQKIKIGEAAFKKIDSEIRLFEALKVYGEKHPLVIQLNSEIPVLTENLKQDIQSLQKLEVGQRKAMMPVLMVPHIDMQSLTAIEGDLKILKPLLEQEVSTHKEMYNSIFKKLQELELSGGGKSWLGMNLIGTASHPGSPIRPNKKMNLFMGLLMGLFLGVGLSFFFEYLDSSLKSIDDITNYLKLFPLGIIPQVESNIPDPKAAKDGEAPDNPPSDRWLVSDANTPLYVAEAYKKIRTNLSLGIEHEILKVIQITSAVKGEGKTTTVSNLGISFAQSGFRVLVVDADMRRPSLHTALRLEGVKAGLSEIIAFGEDWQPSVIQTTTPNLYCLPAGKIPNNPAELLSSKRMKELIHEFKAHFDMVFIDTPPTIAVTDSQLVASLVDGTILTFRSGFIPRHLCQHSKHSIETIKGRIIGCILNGVKDEHHPSYSQYHRYGDYYAESSKQNRKRSIWEKRLAQFKRSLNAAIQKLGVLKEPLLAYLQDGLSRARGFFPRENREGASVPAKETEKESEIVSSRGTDAP